MTAKKPQFVMERVGKDLPPDALVPSKRGGQPLYQAELAKAVEHYKAHPEDDSWWLVATYSSRRAANVAFGRIKRGDARLPVGSEFDFERRTEEETGRGLLYARVTSYDPPTD